MFYVCLLVLPKKPYSTSAVVTLNLSRPIFPILQKKLQAYLDFLTLSALGARCMRSALETRMFFQDSGKNASLSCFWALSTLSARCMGFRAWHSHVFPLLTPVLCFPALGNRYMFSRAMHLFYVFPR